jgi:ATP-dependent Clp protease ATP-binding subunit ClpA
MESADYRKLTDDARGAVAAAIAEATRLGHDEVVAAHLLLGLRTAGSERVVGLLRASGMASVQQARQALHSFDLPRQMTAAASRSLAAELLRVLKAATAQQTEVSASDLCAALLSVENTATELLDVLAVDRVLVMARLGAETESQEGRPRMTTIEDRLQQAVERAELLATDVGRTMDDGDVVVALIDQPGSDAGRALANLGVTRELLEEALADTRPPPEVGR